MKDYLKSCILLSLTLLLSTIVVIPCGFSKTSAPKDLFLQPKGHPTSELEQSEILKIENPDLLERKKIQILINSIALSPYTFIRNGNEYSPDKAASHLRMKYRYAYHRIKTARLFIEHIASRSSMSGSLYEIETQNGERYPTRDVLYNELERLEAVAGRYEKSSH